MSDTEITLIRHTVSGLDEWCQPTKNGDIRTPVLATDVPISRSEFYQAGENGIRPEYIFLINPAEYNGETEVEITTRTGATVRVGIYRTHERNPDELEIYCKQATGLNNPGGGNG